MSYELMGFGGYAARMMGPGANPPRGRSGRASGSIAGSIFGAPSIGGVGDITDTISQDWADITAVLPGVSTIQNIGQQAGDVVGQGVDTVTSLVTGQPSGSSGPSCDAGQCINGYIYNTAHDQDSSLPCCLCPLDSHDDGAGNCIKDDSACPPSQMWSGTACVPRVTCPTNQIPLTDASGKVTCVQQKNLPTTTTCPSGMVMDAVSKLCVMVKPTVVQGPPPGPIHLPPSTCPPGMTGTPPNCQMEPAKAGFPWVPVLFGAALLGGVALWLKAKHDEEAGLTEAA